MSLPHPAPPELPQEGRFGKRNHGSRCGGRAHVSGGIRLGGAAIIAKDGVRLVLLPADSASIRPLSLISQVNDTSVLGSQYKFWNQLVRNLFTRRCRLAQGRGAGRLALGEVKVGPGNLADGVTGRREQGGQVQPIGE